MHDSHAHDTIPGGETMNTLLHWLGKSGSDTAPCHDDVIITESVSISDEDIEYLSACPDSDA